MRTKVKRRATWLVAALLAWGPQSTLPAAAPTDPATDVARPTPASPDVSGSRTPHADATPPGDPEGSLRRGLELERLRSWSAAMEVYDKALEQWPDRTDLARRRRLCETHYRLVRRYQDKSFRNVLLKLPRDRALAVYEEMLERIESHYVDPVPIEPLVRRGLDNMEVALRDPNFLKSNNTSATPEQITRLREALRRQREHLALTDRVEARSQVLAACDLARTGLGLPEAAVILEFTFGACDALDDYTSYLTPDRLDDLYAMIDGNFVGLGIELKTDPNGLKLVGVIRSGPASEVGLKVGDVITQIAGKSVKGLSLDEAANRLQGTEGTAVEIVVNHLTGATNGYKLVRRHVEVESVSHARMIEPITGIGYVQLTGFQKTSTDELDRAIAGLRRQGLKTLVIDLRGNPGGLLNVAVEIAERFVERGVIVSTRGRAPGQSQVYRASERAVWKMPLYVLIDHDSASASEILAGALKDHHRATVIGQRSYGKGSVQSIFALKSAPAGLKLTTAKFYSPTSRPYSEQGVEPDITVAVRAKPTPDAPSAHDENATPGDPATDPVMEQTVRHAKRQLNATR